MAQIIDGKAIAAQLRETIQHVVQTMPETPGLAVILVGDDPASHVYVRNKIKACEHVGINSIERRLPEDTTNEEIERVINDLNADPDIHGILLQLPLPDHLDSDYLIQLIAAHKDVDGLNLRNVGALVAGIDGLVPCTPEGSLILIKFVGFARRCDRAFAFVRETDGAITAQGKLHRNDGAFTHKKSG